MYLILLIIFFNGIKGSCSCVFGGRLTARVIYYLLHFPDLLKPVLLVSLAIIVQLHVQIQLMERTVYSNVIVGLMKSATIYMDV